jgi:hypothetical protein
MSAMPSDFRFVESGLTFACHQAPSRAGASDTWWWFQVSSEPHQRHAPFRAEQDDTPESVQARVVAYHVARHAPREESWHRFGRQNAARRAAAATAGAGAQDAVSAGAVSTGAVSDDAVSAGVTPAGDDGAGDGQAR